MKILVAVKRVIDYNVQIRVKSDQTGVEMDNVKMSMNPPDENAVEEALKLKDSGIATEVVVVSIGQEKCQDTIRSAMAMGADRGILIKTDVSIEPLAVAKILKAIVEKEQPDMVLLGKQAIDDDSNQTGQMLSALLNWPQGCFISKLGINDKTITITREIDEGLEHLEIQLPAVVTCDLRLNEPRFASLPNIMKAKKKPLDVIAIENLEIDISPRVKFLKVEEPLARKGGVMVADVKELIQKLKYEAKVI
ncbi:MAG: electron transfer flavoprotein subunit beta/FixA family protein [Alphaproteobacteria bacterium]|jgi:electron transfer flavoprotein beta subunit